MRHTASALAAGVTMAAAISSAFAGQSSGVTFTPLGDLHGGDFYSVAGAVSADGRFIVGWSKSASGEDAFRWSRGGGLEMLAHAPAAQASHPSSVSDDGSVVVGRTFVPTSRAYRWQESTTSAELLTDASQPGLNFTVARDVSEDGKVIVGLGGTNSEPTTTLVWQGGTLTRIDDSVTLFSSAYGIASDGSRIAGRRDLLSGDAAEAFYWSQMEGMVGLGDLPGGSFHSEGRAISSDGSTVVGFGHDANNNEVAFRWDASSGMIPLGDLPGGAVRSWARAVSGDGSVVVGFSETAFGNDAFIWNEQEGMQSIRGLLLSHGVDLNGWSFNGGAWGISDDGTVITGYGTNPAGATEAWVVTIPSPPTAIFAAILVAGTAVRRHRR